ncbi:MAG: short-chain fatty acyl-CoA regulator family protein [Pseudomonadota bacterium]
MDKIFVGPRLRQLRLQQKQTQADMARAIGVSAAYVNMLENNQRSLSVQVLMALEETYSIDWRELAGTDNQTKLKDLRSALQDPVLADKNIDIQELRSALDHAPGIVESLIRIQRNHRATLDRMMRSNARQDSDALMASSPEAVIYDFFRDHKNYFADLEKAAERLRREEPCEADEVHLLLKRRLTKNHGISVRIRPAEDMSSALRVFDRSRSELMLSEALNHQNRTFQLAHMLCLVELDTVLDSLIAKSGIDTDSGIARCQVELANYFAAAFLMPYRAFYQAAEDTYYDVDRLAAAFGVSFEQACHRLTTLHRRGSEGVPFFFLRIDRAGNVTKRFNATTFNLAEYGGSCPVWNIHSTFRLPGIVHPQFVEMPDGERFFTISRTTERPVFSHATQDRSLALALGCAIEHADRIGYARQFGTPSDREFSPIGISCHLCMRTACPQRAHQPLILDLPIDTDRRGGNRYES